MLPEAVEMFLEAKAKHGLAERSLRDLRSRLGLVSASFRGVRLVEVSGGQLFDWLGSLRGRDGVSPASARSVLNYRRALGAFFAWALRRGWVRRDPMAGLSDADLPRVRRPEKGILSPAEGEFLLRLVRSRWPEFLPGFLVRYFLGVRTAEAGRFRFEWVRSGDRRVVVPGWVGGERVVKTGDSWVLDDVEPAFWRWWEAGKFARQGVFRPLYGSMAARIARAFCEGAGRAWPGNALRHSVATYHLSLHRDPGRTALLLRHRSQAQLWQSYLAGLVPAEEARLWFNPKMEE